MKITATQIAKLAGVSQSAVSKVLNNSPIRISTDRREKIIQIAKKYNYTPNRAAKTLKTGKHNTIAIIVYDLADAFANECINAVEEYLDTTYYQAYWVSCKHAHKANQDPIEFLQNVSQTVDGIVIIHAYDYITDSDIMFLKRTTNFPIITIIRKVPGNRISSVTIDNNIGIHLLMDHLKKLGHTD
ncbi:MAG: LacI family DNA-binding transcriptional regulator, partial [Candidatus Marinimicrobia bacterium]|nr:LacI family DNA-binding transcriptional regulator [Candidatus Neomarinimicrobiota bacterium]